MIAVSLSRSTEGDLLGRPIAGMAWPSREDGASVGAAVASSADGCEEASLVLASPSRLSRDGLVPGDGAGVCSARTRGDSDVSDGAIG